MMNQLHARRVLSVFLFTLLSSAHSFAAAPNLGGTHGCVAAGAWTQSALSATTSLRNAIVELRDANGCSGIKKDFLRAEIEAAKLEREYSELTRVQQDPGMQAALADKNRRDAIRNMYGQIPKSDQDYANVAQYPFNIASLSKLLWKKFVGVGGAGMDDLEKQRMKAHLEMVGKAAFSELKTLSTSIEKMADMNSCFDNNIPAGTRFFTSFIKIAGALNGSNGINSSEVSGLVQSYFSGMRYAKYRWLEKVADDTELNHTLSCLIETTVNNYCDLNEAEAILDWGLQQPWTQYRPGAKAVAKTITQLPNSTITFTAPPKPKIPFVVPGSKTTSFTEDLGPMQMYYAYFLDSRLIANWFTKIRSGMDPQFLMDAHRQNDVDEDAGHFRYAGRNIRGLITERRNAMEAMKKANPGDENARRTLALRTLEEVVNMMQGSSIRNNFYTSGVPIYHIPFQLIGFPGDRAPGIVLGADGKVGWSYSMYISSGGPNSNFIPEFADASAVLETIDRNFRKLYEAADSRVVTYLSSMLVQDKVSLVLNAAVGVAGDSDRRRSVLQAFRNVKAVLTDFKRRLDESAAQSTEENAADNRMIAFSVGDTLDRIQAVIDHVDGFSQPYVQFEESRHSLNLLNAVHKASVRKLDSSISAVRNHPEFREDLKILEVGVKAKSDSLWMATKNGSTERPRYGSEKLTALDLLSAVERVIAAKRGSTIPRADSASLASLEAAKVALKIAYDAEKKANYEADLARVKHHAEKGEMIDRVKNFIDGVIKEFDLVRQQNALLSFRMQEIARYDFAQRVAKGDMTKYQKMLLTLSGNDILDQYGAMLGDNPTAQKQDISNAKQIALKNIEAVEFLTKDRFYSIIREAFARAYPEKMRPMEEAVQKAFGGYSPSMTRGEYDLWVMDEAVMDGFRWRQIEPPWVHPSDFKSSLQELYRSTRFIGTGIQKPRPGTGGYDPISLSFGAWRAIRKKFHWEEGSSERYRYLSTKSADGMPEGWFWGPLFRYEKNDLRDSRFNDGDRKGAREVHARLCALTLSFPDPETYYPYCKGVRLVAATDPADLPERILRIKSNLIRGASSEKEQSEAEKLATDMAQKQMGYYALSYDSTLKSAFRRSVMTNPEPYSYEMTNDRVCAYRNFMRKSQVYHLMRREGFNTDSGSGSNGSADDGSTDEFSVKAPELIDN